MPVAARSSSRSQRVLMYEGRTPQRAPERAGDRKDTQTLLLCDSFLGSSGIWVSGGCSLPPQSCLATTVSSELLHPWPLTQRPLQLARPVDQQTGAVRWRCRWRPVVSVRTFRTGYWCDALWIRISNCQPVFDDLAVWIRPWSNQGQMFRPGRPEMYRTVRPVGKAPSANCKLLD